MPVLGMLARRLGVQLSIFIGSYIYSLGFFLTNWTIQVLLYLNWWPYASVGDACAQAGCSTIYLHWLIHIQPGILPHQLNNTGLIIAGGLETDRWK